MAARSCPGALAYGLGHEVLPRIPVVKLYGKAIDRAFVTEFYDTRTDFLEAVMLAAGYGPSPMCLESLDAQAIVLVRNGESIEASRKRYHDAAGVDVSPAANYAPQAVQQPIGTRDLVLLWATLLHEICRRAVREQWLANTVNVLKAIWERRARKHQPSALTMIVGPPSVARRRSFRMPKAKPLLKPVMPDGVDKLLSVAAEAGEFSGWFEDLQRQAASPVESFKQSFFAGVNRPEEKKVTTALRTFRRWRDWAFVHSQGGAPAVNVFRPGAQPMADFLANVSVG